jgi:SacI restriction endonuclease
MVEQPDSLISKCREVLGAAWKEIYETAGKNPALNYISDSKLKEVIHACVNTQTKTYRYVLPTQLVAKVADPALDSRCVQASRGGKGTFDARSVCDEVIAPFDKENHNVLGGSPEPYVNNPLRVPEITKQHRKRQKDKEGWDALCFVLEKVETRQEPEFTLRVFKQTLLEIYKRLSAVQVTYPIPRRISLEQTKTLIQDFISAKSGGDRVLALTSALLETAGSKFRLYSEVCRSKITAADAATGLVADIECKDSNKRIVLGVEVRDKELTVKQIKDKLPNVRSKKVSEFLFIAQKGVYQENGVKIQELVKQEFVSGQNIYIFNILDFASSLLALLGETGRREFLENVAKTLDRYGSAIEHRKAWADLLSQV